MQRAIRLRAMRDADLPQVLEIQAHCYSPAMQEKAEIISGRLQAAGDTCLVAEDRGKVCAYLFAYRSTLGTVTPLNGAFSPCRTGDTIYLHDLAVGREREGRGVGRLLATTALAHAHERGLRHAALVAVQDAHAYWRRLGFDRYPHVNATARATLLAYPGVPEYLVRALAACPAS